MLILRFLLGSLGVILLFCGCVGPSANSGSTGRGPATSDNLKTRDGTLLNLPKLKLPLNIPACESVDRTKNDECIPAGEAALFDEVTRVSFQFQTAQNPSSVKTSQRDFHARHHACMAGVWTPLDNIPTQLKRGIFGQTKPLRAVIRYSNGSPKSPAGNDMAPPDAKPDARGLAIKLVGVEGESILSVEDREPGRTNQDFVLINFPAFFLRSPKSYPVFISSITKGETLPNGLPSFLASMDPLELSVLKATNTVVADIVQQSFFSQTPYSLGQSYAKYSVRPCQKEDVPPPSEQELKDPRFLRERIRARLDRGGICLIFAVQLKTPQMDVEDAAIEWQQSDSPFVDVAKIVIPGQQNINDSVRDEYCENTSFNPWNSLPENRPVGAINRARLEVYSGISRKRRVENLVPIREPKESDTFFNVIK